MSSSNRHSHSLHALFHVASSDCHGHATCSLLAVQLQGHIATNRVHQDSAVMHLLVNAENLDQKCLRVVRLLQFSPIWYQYAATHQWQEHRRTGEDCCRWHAKAEQQQRSKVGCHLACRGSRHACRSCGTLLVCLVLPDFQNVCLHLQTGENFLSWRTIAQLQLHAWGVPVMVLSRPCLRSISHSALDYLLQALRQALVHQICCRQSSISSKMVPCVGSL